MTPGSGRGIAGGHDAPARHRLVTRTRSRCAPERSSPFLRPLRRVTHIRFALRLVFAVVALGSLYAEPARAQFKNSPYTETIPDYGTCDVTITPSNASSTLKLINDPTERVFCVAPGDYRAFGRILLTESGTASQRRFLRLDIDDGKRNAVQRTQRALFESIVVLRANWWVVQGLTMQPHDGATTWFLTVWGGDHNVLDGNLVDGIEHVPLGTQDAVVVAGYQGDPATYNTLQGNVVRRGNQLRRPGDYEGILIEWGSTATEANDFNKVLDNEVYDWGSGVSVGGYTENCTEPAVQHGTVIDGNDVYITGAKRIDCNTGALDPNGDCSCAEEGLSQKGNPGSNPRDWTRMTNNRLWGFRPTTPKFSCGGTGANGQAIAAGNGC